VIKKTKDLEIDLNTLNYLVGKDDVERALKDILQRNGKIARLIPLLLACRDSDFKILTDLSNGQLTYETFVFEPRNTLSEEEINAVCRFASKTGLLEMFKSRIIRSVPDYVTGVEVGLDSNGRKNRGGSGMETIVQNLVMPICSKYKFDFIPQATSEKMHRLWSVNFKTSREFDFAVKTPRQIFLIEANYYSANGSKLKAVAGEFQTLAHSLKKEGHEFVWVTDGSGWLDCAGPLRAASEDIDYVLNLNMIFKGVLESIFTQRQ